MGIPLPKILQKNLTVQREGMCTQFGVNAKVAGGIHQRADF